jgi:archaeosortase A (PGF-CTERM-specific)
MAVAVIYALNIVRNVFIAVAFGDQWFQVLVDPIMALTGYTDPGLVSFFIADRVMSQSLSVVALVGITWFTVRMVPELVNVIEDALFVVTRTEYDLQAALPIDTSGR